MDFYISVALIAVSVGLSVAAALPIIKILQLSGYKGKGVFAWWKATKYDVLIRYIALTAFSFIAMIVYVGCFEFYEYARYCAVAFYIVLAIVFVASCGKSGANSLKYTGRVKRIIVLLLILDLAVGAGIAWAVYYSPYFQTLTAAYGILTPFNAILSTLILTPLEKLINRKYIKLARAKLDEYKPTVIGITGSYGKTTAKNILRAMLSEFGSVLATPGSFNTPMGVCKTINDNYNGEKYFIAELGARYVGDIKELCGIVNPSFGIITAVGDMHIETFKTRENVAKTKFELAESLPEDGFLALNGYNEGSRELKNRQCRCKTILVGENTDVYYDGVTIGCDGTSFDLYIGGEKHAVTTKLLGAHIPELVCVCAALADKLGVPHDKIVCGISKLEPVEHRLCLVPSANNNVTVIDDAYNSNPMGAKNALQVLSKFGGKKIIVTPGFVELGALEKECNTQLGKDIAAVCDYAFLVGSRAEDIKKGATDGGMSGENIRVFSSRVEAVKALTEIAEERTVLFENDLPDNIK